MQGYQHYQEVHTFRYIWHLLPIYKSHECQSSTITTRHQLQTSWNGNFCWCFNTIKMWADWFYTWMEIANCFPTILIYNMYNIGLHADVRPNIACWVFPYNWITVLRERQIQLINMSKMLLLIIECTHHNIHQPVLI